MPVCAAGPTAFGPGLRRAAWFPAGAGFCCGGVRAVLEQEELRDDDHREGHGEHQQHPAVAAAAAFLLWIVILGQVQVPFLAILADVCVGTLASGQAFDLALPAAGRKSSCIAAGARFTPTAAACGTTSWAPSQSRPRTCRWRIVSGAGKRMAA